MEQFIRDIYAISDPELLVEIKCHIKDKIMDSTLRWDERMALYKQVQFINQWISELRSGKTVAANVIKTM